MPNLPKRHEQDPIIGSVLPTGPIIEIRISIAEPVRQALSIEGEPEPASLEGPALIDTGSGYCVVDTTQLAKLDIRQTGMQTVGFPGTKSILYRPVYAVDLVVPQLATSIEIEHAVSMDLAGFYGYHRPLLALLGRDFLAKFKFSYDGPAGVFALGT